MTTGVQTSSRANFLRNVLIANDLFCTAFGLLFIFGAGAVADFAGVSWAPYFRLLGFGLLVFAGFVFYTAYTGNRRLARVIFWLDVAWVVGSYALLVLNVLPITNEAKWAFAFIGDAVLVFAILEYWALRQSAR